MIVAPDYETYPHAVAIAIHTWEEWDEVSKWAELNGIAVQVSFGSARFEKEEHAVLFKLKFRLAK